MTNIQQRSTTPGRVIMPKASTLPPEVVEQLAAGFNAKLLSEETPAELDASKLMDAVPSEG